MAKTASAGKPVPGNRAKDDVPPLSLKLEARSREYFKCRPQMVKQIARIEVRALGCPDPKWC